MSVAGLYPYGDEVELTNMTTPSTTKDNIPAVLGVAEEGPPRDPGHLR